MKKKNPYFYINLTVIWLNHYISDKGIKIQAKLYRYFYIKQYNVWKKKFFKSNHYAHINTSFICILVIPCVSTLSVTKWVEWTYLYLNIPWFTSEAVHFHRETAVSILRPNPSESNVTF